MPHDVQPQTPTAIDPNLLIEVGNAAARCGCGGHHEMNDGQCPVKQPDFPRFFPGQLVEPDDLNAIEHRVFTHEQLRARHTIGWGIACGFRVAIDGNRLPTTTTAKPPPGPAPISIAGAQLRVESGYGIDRFGRDVYLAETRTTSLQELFDERDARIKQAMGDPWCVIPGCQPEPATHFCVAVRYKECEQHPVPSYAQQCGTPKTVCEYSRIREDVELRVFADNEFPPIPSEFRNLNWCGLGVPNPGLAATFLAMLQIPYGPTDADPSDASILQALLAANVETGGNLKVLVEDGGCDELLHLARPCAPCIDWPWIPLACFTREGSVVTDPDCRVRRTIYSLQELEALMVRMFCILANQTTRGSKVTIEQIVGMFASKP